MKHRIQCCVLACCLAAGAAEAQEPPKWIAWQFQGENDALAVFSGSDEFYTQGLYFRFWRHPEFTPDWAETMGGWLGRRLYKDKPGDLVVGFGFGQYMFTPESLKPTELIEDDRPYAGWLYGGLLFAITEPVPVEDRPVQQLFEIQLGVLGPESGAEWAQKAVHELIDDEEPMGWDNQLPFEPAINLYYQWRQRFGTTTADFVPNLGFALGTHQVYLNAGGTVRLGRHISDFGPLLNAGTIFSRENQNRHPWEAYLFAGADGRAVARNVFLDGNTFRDSHSVDKDDFVYDLKAGFSLRYGAFRFTYTFARRSQEFSPLPVGGGKTDGDHDFGSFNISFEKKLRI